MAAADAEKLLRIRELLEEIQVTAEDGTRCEETLKRIRRLAFEAKAEAHDLLVNRPWV